MAGKTRKTRKSRGFTLSELLVAIGVLALVALIATPGLGEYLRDCRRAATLDMLTHAVHAARAAAAALGVRATLCGTMDGRSCSRLEDWSDALLVLPDPAEGEAPPHWSALAAGELAGEAEALQALRSRWIVGERSGGLNADRSHAERDS